MFEVSVMELDEVDYKILETLKTDARTPFTEIGRELGISDATVHVRVKKMMDEGIIKKYTIEVGEEVFGKNVHGFVLINVTPGALAETVKQLAENEKVSEIYEIHGPNDLIAKVGAANLDDMRKLMLEIRETPNVTTTELITVLKRWKERKD
jgi:Lrp/AsnC family transcriptional regulator for asnA, asnC and gidA